VYSAVSELSSFGFGFSFTAQFTITNTKNKRKLEVSCNASICFQDSVTTFYCRVRPFHFKLSKHSNDLLKQARTSVPWPDTSSEKQMKCAQLYGRSLAQLLFQILKSDTD
jgi:hypothetical protein